MVFKKISDLILQSECGCYLVVKKVDVMSKRVSFQAWGNDDLIDSFDTGGEARGACEDDYASQRPATV